jgi:hypothetical protein
MATGSLQSAAAATTITVNGAGTDLGLQWRLQPAVVDSLTLRQPVAPTCVPSSAACCG